jgi:hypothetical protein
MASPVDTSKWTTSRWQHSAAIDAVNRRAGSQPSRPLGAKPIHDAAMEEPDEYSEQYRRQRRKIAEAPGRRGSLFRGCLCGIKMET